MSDVRAHVLVRGRVQGVFFRQSAAREARRHGVTGWIRNVPGGEVEALFEGSRDRVEAVVAWCRTGPPAAQVEEIEVAWDEEPAVESDFRIRG